jgi:VanZ family protein
LWGLFILLLTSIPGRIFPDVPSYLDLFQPDKIIHLTLFALFTVFLIHGFRKQGTPGFIFRNHVMAAIITGILFGAVTEIIQLFFIPNRLASPWDFTANVAGCFAGWVCSKVGK